jgi:hypothetical protein
MKIKKIKVLAQMEDDKWMEVVKDPNITEEAFTDLVSSILKWYSNNSIVVKEIEK